jgi:hypothetical protein
MSFLMEIKKINSVDVIDDYLDSNNKKKEDNNNNPLYNSDIFWNCFNEDTMINNVVSCKEEDMPVIDDCLSDSDEKVVEKSMAQSNDTENMIISKNNTKYKKQKTITRIGAVAVSTFALMGSAWISRNA